MASLHKDIIDDNKNAIFRKLSRNSAYFINKLQNEETPLHIAVQKGAYDIVVLLLQAKADPNIPDRNSDTPLHLAIKNHYSIIVSLLLQAKANPNIPDINGNTPLHLSIIERKIKYISLLLQAKADPNTSNTMGHTPLHLIVLHFNVVDRSELNLLLHTQVNINAPDKNNQTPLYIAVKRNLSIVSDLLNYGANPNEVYQGKTLLALAIENNDKETVEMLLRYGASLSNQHPPPLYKAIINSHNDASDIVYKLLKYGADPNVQYLGETLLNIAIKEGGFNVVNTLLLHDANIKLPGESGRTALHTAAQKGNSRILDIILLYSSNINILDDDKKTPLQLSTDPDVIRKLSYRNNKMDDNIRHKIINLEQFIIPNNIDINALDHEGKTILYLAIERSTEHFNYKMIGVIMGYNPDVTIPDYHGKTVLYLAIEKGLSQVVNNILKKNNDNINVKYIGTTFLHLAVSKSNQDVVAMLLSNNKVIVNIYDQGHRTPFAIAIENNDIEIALMLLQNGAKKYHSMINLPDNSNNTPLHIAAEKGYNQGVEMLLTYGAYVHLVNKNGKTPLQLAINNKHNDVIRKLSNISINDQLCEAVKSGILSQVKILLQHGGADPNYVNDKNETPLQLAMSTKSVHRFIVEELLKYGADPNLLPNNKLPSAIHLCIANNHKFILSLLLIHGADPNVKFDEMTPLHLAVVTKFYNAIPLLILRGADSNITLQGWTALSLAVHNGANDYIYDSLITSNIDINYKCEGNSLLHSAILKNRSHFVKTLLIVRNIDVNILDNEHNTPLHLAISKGRFPIVKSLLFMSHDININILNKNMQTPLHLAVNKNNVAIVKILLRYPVDKNVVDFTQRTALQIAQDNNYIDIVEILSHHNSVPLEGLGSHHPVLQHLQSRDTNHNARKRPISPGDRDSGDAPVKSMRHNPDTSLSSNDGAMVLSRQASECLPGTSSRMKRSVVDCKIGWEDVDEIVNVKTRKVDEIIIDSRKFLEYSKNIKIEGKSLQLFSLVQEIQGFRNDKVIGANKYLLNKVVKAGSYSGYIEGQRIEDLSYHATKDNININPVLTKHLHLVSIAGKIQLMRGLHGTVVSCKYAIEDNSNTIGCYLGIGSLSYVFLSSPIERAVLKVMPRIIYKATYIGGTIISPILGYNVKLVVQIVGSKYATIMSKGVVGAVLGIFDIVDIAISSNHLVDCSKRQNSNNVCSDKEIRDSIAAIGFSGVSFVSCAALVALGSGGIAILVGLSLVVTSGVYSGASNVIEYSQLYDTTVSENWSIFWRTALLQEVPDEIQSLSQRYQIIDHITTQAKSVLDANDHITSYSIGLGKVKKIECSITHIQSRTLLKPKQDFNINYTNSTIEPSYSRIDMSNSNIDNTFQLSRVLPRLIDDITMTCLPKATNANYENGVVKTQKFAVYYCDNALTMQKNSMKLLSDKNYYNAFDLRYIKNGTIHGSNIYNNIYYIYEGQMSIYSGANVQNIFHILKSHESDECHSQQHKVINYYSSILYLNNNSTNVIDASKLTTRYVNVEYHDTYSLPNKMMIYLDDFNSSPEHSAQTITVHSLSHNTSIRYIGREGKQDKVICKTTIVTDDNEKNSEFIVDTRGGGSDFDSVGLDEVTNCKKVIISPNTHVTGQKAQYIFYINLQDFLQNKSIVTHNKPKVYHSRITISGNATITFSDVSILSTGNNISYSKVSDSLKISMQLTNGNVFNLYIRNYLNSDSYYNIIDNHNSNISPIINKDDNIGVVEKFNLYNERSFNSTIEVINYYRNISQRDDKYSIFGTLKNDLNKNIFKFGSSDIDVIYAEQGVVFIEGGEGSDIYIVDHISCQELTINNESKDLKFDILSINSINDIRDLLPSRNSLDLSILNYYTVCSVPQKIIIKDYFSSIKYQHLILMDKHNKQTIPFVDNIYEDQIEFIPFYQASLSHDIFELSVSTDKQHMLNILKENIIFQKLDNDLLLIDNEPQYLSALKIILKDYYLQQALWKDIKLYSYHDGNYSLIDLGDIKLFDYSYTSIAHDYIESFATKHKTISHNQKKIGDKFIDIPKDEEKLGVMIFKDIDPHNLQILDSQDDLILKDNISDHQLIIKNWYKDNRYKMSILEFDVGLAPIRISTLEKGYNNLQDQINCAAKLYNIKMMMKDPLYDAIRCVISSDSANISNMYEVLGFTSMFKYVDFLNCCNDIDIKLVDLMPIKELFQQKYLEVLLCRIELQTDDVNQIMQHKEIIHNHIKPILNRIVNRVELNDKLDKALKQLSTETLDTVKYFIIRAGDVYDDKILRLDLGFNDINEQCKFIQKYESNHTKEMIQDILNIQYDIGKATMLLVAQFYNELLFKYQNIAIEESLDLLNDGFITTSPDSCPTIYPVIDLLYQDANAEKIFELIEQYTHTIQKCIASQYSSDIDISDDYISDIDISDDYISDIDISDDYINHQTTKSDENQVDDIDIVDKVADSRVSVNTKEIIEGMGKDIDSIPSIRHARAVNTEDKPITNAASVHSESIINNLCNTLFKCGKYVTNWYNSPYQSNTPVTMWQNDQQEIPFVDKENNYHNPGTAYTSPYAQQDLNSTLLLADFLIRCKCKREETYKIYNNYTINNCEEGAHNLAYKHYANQEQLSNNDTHHCNAPITENNIYNVGVLG